MSCTISITQNGKANFYDYQVHIEQGPVLESLGQPLGVVEGIAGQTRLKVCAMLSFLVFPSSRFLCLGLHCAISRQ